jgi:hypothetical protein
MASMLESGFRTLLGREGPDRLPASFSDDAFLKLSGSRLGDKRPLCQLVPALAFRYLFLISRGCFLRSLKVTLSSLGILPLVASPVE